MPQIDLAKATAAGYTPQQVQQFAAQNGVKVYNSVQQTVPQAPAPQPQGGGLADWLPTIGAIAGGFTPLGPIFGGAGGALLGTLGKQALKGGSDVGELAKETALGGVGGILGKVASPIFRGITGAVGTGAENVGENLALRALRPTKTQLANFAERHGVDLGEYIQKGGLVGKAGEQIAAEHIEPLQQSFNAIAKNVQAPIDRKLLNKNFSEQIVKLLNTGSSDDAKLAEQLMKEARGINSQLNKTGDTFAEVNRLRQNFDSKVEDWLGNPIEGGKNRLAGSALRDTLQQSADQLNLTGPNGESLKDLGIELSKLYSVKDIADLQANLGRGTLPLGLSKLLGIAAGGAATGGGLPGAAAGLIGATALNNPRVISGISKGATALGEGLSENAPRIGAGLGQTVGQISAQGLPMPGIPTAQAAETNQPTQQELVPSQNTTQQDLFRQKLGMYILGRARNASDLKAGYDLLYPKTLQQDPFINKAVSNIDAIMQSKNLGYGPVAGNLANIGISRLGGAGVSPEVIALNQRYQLLKLNILRAYQGARISDADFRLATLYTPTIVDTPTTARTKLQILKQILQKTPDMTDLRQQGGIPPPANYPGLGQ